MSRARGSAYLAKRSLLELIVSLSLASAGCCCPSAFAESHTQVVSGASAASQNTAGLGASLGPRADSVTETRFRRVDFDVGLGIVLGIRHLRGEMVSTTPGPIVFDDKRSFVIRIDTADVALSSETLSHLMNNYVFAYPGAPLRNLTVRVTGTQLTQRGVLHKGVDIPFELSASLSVTPEGLMRIHPTTMRIFSVDGTGLLNALGLKLSSLLDVSKAKGVTVRGNDLLLDINLLLPPPAIHGRLVAVRIESGELVQSFGRSAGGGVEVGELTPPDTTASNYMYFRGGTLRFGNLIMVHSNMQITDLDPTTPFDFSIDGYQRQLVAGYSSTRRDLSLEVFMPDYSSVSARAADRP
jgi:hypothetical protein